MCKYVSGSALATCVVCRHAGYVRCKRKKGSILLNPNKCCIVLEAQLFDLINQSAYQPNKTQNLKQ